MYVYSGKNVHLQVHIHIFIFKFCYFYIITKNKMHLIFIKGLYQYIIAFYVIAAQCHSLNRSVQNSLMQLNVHKQVAYY